MMNKLNSLRKSKAGFTLVELIVVLVILAILAALLIPALTGYIDEAKEKQIIAETRMCVMAVQTLASEAYGDSDTADYDDTDPNKKDVAELAEVDDEDITSWTVSGGKVTELTFSSEYATCEYKDGTYTVTKK